jgi:hypothetical protein
MYTIHKEIMQHLYESNVFHTIARTSLELILLQKRQEKKKRAFTTFTFQSRDKFCTTKAMAKLTLIHDSSLVCLTSAKQPSTQAA